jgi:hypothetical protein
LKQLRRNWEIDLTVVFKDDDEQDAQVDGQPVFTSSADAELAIVNMVQHGTSTWQVTLQAVGPIGATPSWTVTADADLGDGVVPVTASDEIQITSGTATSVGTSYGEPRPMQTT